MKKIFITTIMATLGWGFSQAQVAVGKNEITNASISLEFAETEARGLLLPWVDSQAAVADVENGTLVYDANDHKVKVKYATGWKDLSIDETGTLGTATQPATEKSNAQVRIGGTETDTTAGILVLADTDKAMILPKVADTDEIINPAAGMMVYIESKALLAVFNGAVWTFWSYQ